MGLLNWSALLKFTSYNNPVTEFVYIFCLFSFTILCLDAVLFLTLCITAKNVNNSCQLCKIISVHTFKKECFIPENVSKL